MNKNQSTFGMGGIAATNGSGFQGLRKLVLAMGAALLISIVLLYIARFSARLEFKDLGSLRSMFDRFPAWGKRVS